MNKFFMDLLMRIGLLLIMPISPVVAGCIDADISSQSAVTNGPIIQNNRVDSIQEETCFGNSAVTANVQFYFGENSAIQERQRTVYQGGNSNNPLNVFGITTPKITNHIEQKISIPLNPFD